MQSRQVEHRLHRVEGRGGLVVRPLAAQRVPGMDLAQRQPRLHRTVGSAFEDRRGIGRGLIRLMLGVAVVPEGPVKPRHELGMTLLERLVHRRHAHDLADAARLCRMQAEEADIVGRRLVVGIVVVEAQVDVRHRGPDTRAWLQLRTGVHHVVEHLAVQLLRHGAGQQARQQPIDADRLVAVHLVERQAVEHGEHRAFLRHAPHLVHGRTAGVELEVRGIEQERRHRRAADLVAHRAHLRQRRGRQRHRPAVGRDRLARPGLHCVSPRGRFLRSRIPRPGSVRYPARGRAGADRPFRAGGGRGPARTEAHRFRSDAGVPRPGCGE